MRGILDYTEEPLVSSDLKGDAHSSIFSAFDTLVIGGNLAKVVAWYDNEWGYSMRVADLLSLWAKFALKQRHTWSRAAVHRALNRFRCLV